MPDLDEALPQLTLSEYTSRLASGDPVPGGGSAAAVAASLGASLIAMVARLSEGRARYASYEMTHARVGAAGERWRIRFLSLAEEDERAYAAFSEARRRAKDPSAEAEGSQAALRAAARLAAEVPLAVVSGCRSAIDEVEALAGRSNLNAASDLEVAAYLLQAAARGAAANVLANLPSAGDEGFAGGMTAAVESHLKEIERTVPRVRELAMRGELRRPESE